MSDFQLAMLVGAVPIAGILLGVLLAEAFRISDATLSLALHLAGGAVFAVVGVELMPRALELEPPWIVVAAFVLGGAFFIGVKKAIAAVQRARGNAAAGGSAPWAIFVGVGMDYFTDGIMIGTGTAIAVGVGVVFALGQAVANAPGAFVTLAELKKQRPARGIRLVSAGAFAVLILGGTALGHLLMRGQPDAVRLAVLAFTAGILTLVVVEEMGPRADVHARSEAAPFSVLAGFAVFTLIALYFG